MQLDIIEVTTSLARETKKEASIAIVGAITDVIRHLRKSVHLALDDADLGADVIKWNKRFHEVVDECLVELSSKVLFIYLAVLQEVCFFICYWVLSLSWSNRLVMRVQYLTLWLECWRMYLVLQL